MRSGIGEFSKERLIGMEDSAGELNAAALIDAMKRFGIPRAIRSDNEATLCSMLLPTALFLLGIRHLRRLTPAETWSGVKADTLKASRE